MRDYARKNHRSTGPRQKSLGVLAIILATLAIAFPLGMLYMKHQKILEQQKLSQNLSSKKMLAEKPKDPNPQFDFYTLLPKLKVPNDLDENLSQK